MMVEIQNDQYANKDIDTEKVEGVSGVKEHQQDLIEETGQSLEEYSVEDIPALLQELEETRAKADEYLDGWQRARAEFTNYKKRIDREQAQIYQTVTGNIIKQYMEITDDFERALSNKPPGSDGAEWANGVDLIYRKLLAILQNEGVVRMDAQGQVFDPNLHEAITSEESDTHKSGEIIEVLQPGYMIGNRVLRPAMVRVAK
jgi:molecular chaperone GrpE